MQPRTTPTDENLFNIRESSLLSVSDAKRFHLFVHLTLVAFLTTRVQSPTEDDSAKLHRGMEYIIGTTGLSLNLEVEGPIRVTAYVDASFATHSSHMKSHTGVSITLGKRAFYCRSSKQKLVTKLSSEAELVGISDVLPQIVCFKHFLEADHVCSYLGRQSVYDMTAANDHDTSKSVSFGYTTS